MTNDGEIPKIVLKSCPFCGSDVEKEWTGNRNTRNQRLVIKCTKFGCSTQQATRAMHRSAEWLNEVGSRKWNTRIADNNKGESK